VSALAEMPLDNNARSGQAGEVSAFFGRFRYSGKTTPKEKRGAKYTV